VLGLALADPMVAMIKVALESNARLNGKKPKSDDDAKKD
jgi:hypothetical protein